jgi:hypothetical protein
MIYERDRRDAVLNHEDFVSVVDSGCSGQKRWFEKK